METTKTLTLRISITGIISRIIKTGRACKSDRYFLDEFCNSFIKASKSYSDKDDNGIHDFFSLYT